MIVDELALTLNHMSLDQWLARYHAQIVDRLTFSIDPYIPPDQLYLTRVD